MNTKTKIILIALALGASPWFATAQDDNQRPDGQRPPPREGGQGGPRGFGPGAGGQNGPGHAGGFGRMGGPGGQGGFHILPPPAMQHLNLTAEQHKKLAHLEAKVKAKLEKILTREQMQQLHQMRPPQAMGGPNGGGPGRPDGFQGPDRRGDQDGQGGQRGPGRFGGPRDQGGQGGPGRPGGPGDQGGQGGQGEGRPQRPAPEL